MYYPPHLTPYRRFQAAWVIIALAALPLLALFGFAVASYPIVLAVLPLLAIPASLLWGALYWIDRHEPEPRDAKALAFIWGAVVAVAFAGTINSVVAYLLGDTAAVVLSAPITEEIGKAAVLFFIWQRRLINSALDGVVYMFCSAAGFAIVEDLLYFTMGAAEEGVSGLATTVVVRGLLTPFAHPLFSLPVGLAVGWAASHRHAPQRSAALLTGAVTTSMVLHAAWNGGLTLAAALESGAVVAAMLLFFVTLFIAAVVTVVKLRSRQARWFDTAAGPLILHLNLNPAEAAVFRDTKGYLRYLDSLPKHTRPHLRELRWTLHSLAAAHSRTPHNHTEHATEAAHIAYLTHRVALLRHQMLQTRHRP